MTKNEDLKALLPCDFPKTVKKRQHLLHVYDAGHDPHVVKLKCKSCEYDNGWAYLPEKTITELKRGIPCPKCN